MAEFSCLEPVALERFLERRRASPQFPLELSLAENLLEVLRKANQFVPSDAGSILLDNPIEKQANRRLNTLTFIAAFGESSEGLLGQQIQAGQGIAGHTYLIGEAYVADEAHFDPLFYPGVDKETKYRTRSIVAIPIRIGQEVCGVLELINRREADTFSERDRHLLEVFADYISISIQNVLDGRKAAEIARRDNLTGLYNDRYLHIALSLTIAACRATDRDLAVIFLDLDYFKRVNDQHGHLAGSQVLREVGGMLRGMIRNPEAIAARYGGDEFVIALPGIDLATARALAEEIRQRCSSETYCGEPGDIQPEALSLSGITCSIGVATLRREVAGAQTVEAAKSALLKAADTAMYLAKETGRDRVAILDPTISGSFPGLSSVSRSFHR
jgi:diguanylate cyclase (GGDEF)-like protein